jgi:hypothetical protein
MMIGGAGGPTGTGAGFKGAAAISNTISGARIMRIIPNPLAGQRDRKKARWAPVPGRHEISLTDGQTTYDRVRVTVR